MMAEGTADAVVDEQTSEGYGSSGYRAYVLFALIVVYTFNFIDRTLIGVLGEQIRETFGLSDFMIGILSGLAFAVLYTLLGIPFAMLAERKTRNLDHCAGHGCVERDDCGLRLGTEYVSICPRADRRRHWRSRMFTAISLLDIRLFPT